MGGGPSGGQNAQGGRGRPACLSGEVRLGLSFQAGQKQWEGSRPVKSEQAPPLFLLLDIQALLDTQGLTAPREGAVL